MSTINLAIFCENPSLEKFKLNRMKSSILVFVFYLVNFAVSKPNYSVGPCNSACRNISVSNFTVDQVKSFKIKYQNGFLMFSVFRFLEFGIAMR